MLVLSLLKDEPMRFSELQDLSGMSPRGLAKVLADLSDDKLVSREIKGRWLAYGITKKGRFAFSDTMTLGIIMDQIQKDDGEYFHDYFERKGRMNKQGLSWGIQDDIVINRELENKIRPLLDEIIKNIQNTIYENTRDALKIKNIDFKDIKNKKILLGIIIEYDELIKSINETSLEKYNNINKKINKKYPKSKFVKANEALSEAEPI